MFFSSNNLVNFVFDIGMKRLFFEYIVSCVLLLCLFNACKREKYHEPDVYDRVVLYYMDGKENNLSQYIIQNYNEIKEGYVPKAKSADVLLVYIHNDRWPAQLIRLTSEGGYVKETLIKEFSFNVSAQPAVIRQILNFTAERFPSYQNGLVFSSHGTGYLPVGYYKSPANFIISKSDGVSVPYTQPIPVYDDFDYSTTGTKAIGDDVSNSTDIWDLAELLPLKYDFIIFDCCLMGCVEVAYQLRNKVDNIVFSQTEILARGMDYVNMAKALFAKDGPDLNSVCTDYMNLYNNTEDPSATISLVRTDCIDSLASICNRIMSYSSEQIKSIDRNGLQRYFRTYTPVRRDFFYDLDDFMKVLASDKDYERFKACLDAVVVCAYHTDSFMIYDRGFKLDRNCGFSTYVPINYASWHPYLNNCYQLLDWCRDVYGENCQNFPYL